MARIKSAGEAPAVPGVYCWTIDTDPITGAASAAGVPSGAIVSSAYVAILPCAFRRFAT